MDERVNCMTCLLAEDCVPGVTITDGITHALAPSGYGYVFRLCDFDGSDVLRPGTWPGRRVDEADVLPPLAKAGGEPRPDEVVDADAPAPRELREGREQGRGESNVDRVGHREKVSPGL